MGGWGRRGEGVRGGGGGGGGRQQNTNSIRSVRVRHFLFYIHLFWIVMVTIFTALQSFDNLCLHAVAARLTTLFLIPKSDWI